MALDPAIKQEIIKEYATHEGDTGSPEVQIAVLSRRISDLTEHLKFHKHDHHSRRGLMILVGRRRNMLGYLKDIDIERYRLIIESLVLRGYVFLTLMVTISGRILLRTGGFGPALSCTETRPFFR